MTRRVLIGTVIVLGVLFLVLRLRTSSPGTNSLPGRPSPSQTPLRAPQSSPTVEEKAQAIDSATTDLSLPRQIVLIPGMSELVADLNNPKETPEKDIEILNGVIAQYRKIMGENPSGGLNEEIVASLLGANSRKISVLPSKLAALNSKGELVDRWGTPFYFHPVSKNFMGILSAGPDRELWTADDVGQLRPEPRE